MIGIIYSTRHGATAKIAKVINAHFNGACRLMNLKEMDTLVVDQCSTIVLGMSVYNNEIDEDMIHFIIDKQDMLKEKNYSIYISSLFYKEFMDVLTPSLSYDILKNVKVIAGLGGAIYYPFLTVREKMQLKVLNNINKVIPKNYHEDVFENFDLEEIEIFANKIRKIDEA